MSDSINPYAPPHADVLPPIDPSKYERLATPWRRLGACIIDTLILLVVLVPIIWFSGSMTRILEGEEQGFGVSLEQIVWAMVSFTVYLILNWNALEQGQTIGKRALELRVVSKDGQPVTRSHIILKRSLPLHLLSLIPYGGNTIATIDSLLIFRPNRNTAHDDFAGTKVVDLRPL